MKTTLFLLFAFLFPLKQDLNNLDKKYGFQKFKLESPMSQHKANLKPKDIGADTKVKYYNYTGGDIKTVFDSDVDEIILGYYKGKLYYIKIAFKKTTWFHKDNIYKKLETLFGVGGYDSNYKNGNVQYDWGYQWKGKKAYLSFDKESDDEMPSIWLLSQPLHTQIANDEF